MSKVNYCTPEGYKALLNLQAKIKEQRSELIEIMGEATKGSGEDLSENTEYLQAKEELDRVEIKFAELNSKLQLSKIIDITTLNNNGVAVFGSTISLFNVDKETNVKYKIVGVDESNIKEGKISLESPLARAIIGHSEGDEIDVITPSGDDIYEILKIEYI